MKKLIVAGLILGAFLVGLVQVAKANTITIGSNIIDVGERDSIIYSGSPNSGDANEIKWVNDALKTLNLIQSDLSADFYKLTNGTDPYDQSAVNFWNDSWHEVVGSTDLWAFKLKDNVDYFFLKIGGTTPNHLLYANDGSNGEDYAVVSLSEIGNLVVNQNGTPTTMNFGKISHIGEFYSDDPPPNPVPEPATMLLFGTGIVSLIGACRRKKNKKIL